MPTRVGIDWVPTLLRGRAKKEGQRVGEMEIGALGEFGVAHILLETLYKSDDIRGHHKIPGTMLIRGKTRENKKSRGVQLGIRKG